ncbi:MAG: STAS domain-containing protein [Brevinema sp.]
MGNIYLGTDNSDLYIVVEGRGTAEYCSDLKNRLEVIIHSMNIKSIFFDVKNADYVDSSFIGLILCTKKKCNHCEVALLNPSKSVKEIFTIMGLESFISICEDPQKICTEQLSAIDQKLEHSIADIKLLLESHQEIMSTSPENKKRFALVEKVFLQELQKKILY